LQGDELSFVLTRHWRKLGLTLDDAAFTDSQARLHRENPLTRPHSAPTLARTRKGIPLLLVGSAASGLSRRTR
jgi:hypothetical protein